MYHTGQSVASRYSFKSNRQLSPWIELISCAYLNSSFIHMPTAGLSFPGSHRQACNNKGGWPVRAEHQSSLGLVHPVPAAQIQRIMHTEEIQWISQLDESVHKKWSHGNTFTCLFSQSHNHTLTEVIKIWFVTLRASKRNITRKLDATLASCDLYTSWKIFLSGGVA